MLTRSDVLPLPGAITDGYVPSLFDVLGDRIMLVAVTADATLILDS